MSPLIRLAAVALLLAITACESTPTKTTGEPAPETIVGPIPESAPAARHFAAVTTGTRGTPEVFGSYTRGCLAGADHLDLEGPTWQVLHPSRNRAWGHPRLIAFVRTLADKVAGEGYRGLLVGDLAQPRGGPLPSSHASHQVGLDADIWLTPLPSRKLGQAEADNYDPPSLVNFSTLRVTDAFGAAQYAMIRRAAETSGVERIFVSPPIKRAMCERTTDSDRSWLRKLRPWFGHSAHMHVRLACPTDSDDCKAQDEPPEGDGCGSELQSWFSNRSWMTPKPDSGASHAPMGLDGLPAACRRLLTDRG